MRPIRPAGTDLAARTHRRLLAAVAVLVVATLAGLVVLWPGADELPDPGVRPDDLLAGTIVAVEHYQGEPDEIIGTSGASARLQIELESGSDAGETIVIDTPLEGYPEFNAGDRVKLSTSVFDGQVEYFVVDFERTGAMWWLLALFVVAVLAVGRWHGFRSLLGLGLSLLVVTRFIVPAILAGQPPFWVALVGASAVMLVSLYLAHGVNEMTTTAVVGTSLALTITMALGAYFIDAAALTGYASEEANLARFSVEGLDLKGLVLAGLIIAALGVLDDVTVSQASTVFQLHEADRTQGWGQLFGRAMHVGRDHIASTINTLFLAYAGASLALLVLFSTSGLALSEVANLEIIAEEVVKTIVGSLGIITAVPFTTALAATLAVRRPLDGPPLRGQHHGHGPQTGARAPAAAAAGDERDEADEGEISEEERARRAWSRYLSSTDDDA